LSCWVATRKSRGAKSEYKLGGGRLRGSQKETVAVAVSSWGTDVKIRIFMAVIRISRPRAVFDVVKAVRRYFKLLVNFHPSGRPGAA
jgi:hypothetical protein